MTAAAGFAFDSGILFCADTKVSTSIQTNENKLLSLTYGSGECATVFAISAYDLNFAKAAVRDCEDAISKINLVKAPLPSVRKAIESALAKFYKTHIFSNPDRQDIAFRLLVGIWLRGETQIYSSQETVLNHVKQYECLGSGGYLANYYVKQFLKSQQGPLSLEDAALIASYAMKSAMEYDGYSGGENADFIILKANGEIGDQVNCMVYPGEQFPEKIQHAMWTMLRDLARLGDSGMEVESDHILEKFFDAVREINSSYKWWFDFRASLINSITPSSSGT